MKQEEADSFSAYYSATQTTGRRKNLLSTATCMREVSLGKYLYTYTANCCNLSPAQIKCPKIDVQCHSCATI